MKIVTISRVDNATSVETTDTAVEKVIEAIRTGGKRLKGQITQIRNRFESELAITGDYKKAKLAVDALKKQLPAVTWSGTFSKRANDALIDHSGLLCADLDSLNGELASVREKLLTSPYLWALFVSPSGDGLKAVFRVPADAAKHAGSFRAVERLVLELTGIQIDQSGKDAARLCFMSYDPDIYANPDARETEPLPEPEKQECAASNYECPPDLNLRERITFELLGHLSWSAEKGGYFIRCPGEASHTNGTAGKHCIVYLEGSPTIKCQHTSCAKIVEAFNHQLRSLIGKAEHQPPKTSPLVEVHNSKPAELPPAPAPYIPPPLTLLPQVLQEYVLAAAEALNVDRAFILLPVLSSLGAATGNARSILLKRGFVQPPVIWTGIIGRSGTRKSPALEAGCLPVMRHERKLNRENETAAQIEDEFQKGKSKNGEKKVAISTCVCDDLTIEVLADRLVANPHGLLVRKDELSHWLASFDQYKNAKGSDVSRWLSLHTGVFVAVDRKKDNLHHRIWQPRVCITGGIQPKVFRRILTTDYFERGLPARFLLADPPFRQDKWSEATVPEDLQKAVLELFDELWLLQPGNPEDSQSRPNLLRLEADAKTVFVDFYNACGTASVGAGEHEEAAWNKLTGYGARLALVGQLARDSKAENTSGKVMQAASDLARWFGNEAMRIYAELAETREQRELRELCEFVERRGGGVTVRDAITYHWPLKNQPEKAEQQFEQLVRAGRGRWEQVKPLGRGRPTRIFRLLRSSASAKNAESRRKRPNCADAEAVKSEKNTPPGSFDSGDEAWPEGVRVEDGKVII
jgi:Protein of unknown function (DUF3987)/VirE N-terminal domain